MFEVPRVGRIERDHAVELRLRERSDEIAEGAPVSSTHGEHEKPDHERPERERRAPEDDLDDEPPHLLDVTA